MNRTVPHVNMTPRDLNIVQMVYDYGGCAISHIHRRLWIKDSCPSGCYRRVSILTAAKYLRSHRLPALVAQGSGRAMLTPGSRAHNLPIDLDDHRPLSMFRRSHEVSAFFAEHHFAICDFRVALEQAVDSLPRVELDGWILEPTLKKSPIRVPDVNSQGVNPGAAITLIPDGAFRLRFDGQEQIAYLEMDMGTIAHARLEQRLRGYLLLNRSATKPVPLFFVTTCSERVTRIVASIAKQAQNAQCDPTTIFVATLGDVESASVLSAPIWHRAGVSGTSAILSHPQVALRHHENAVFDGSRLAVRLPRSAVA
jgi:hypothetical protein